VDKMLWVSMTGAEQMLEAQGIIAHNMANASTTGFRADRHAFSSYLIQGPGYATRVNAVAEQLGFDPRSGTFEGTGRDLDVAINGSGWLAVTAPDGTEAYTRAGSLRINPTGGLETATGYPVLGDGGPVSIPPFNQVALANDGTISVVPQGLGPATMAAVARLKLVDPPLESLVKGPDGLMRLKDGSQAPLDGNVRVSPGGLESSNVNIAETLVEMIDLARQYEMQIRMMSTAEQTAQSAQQLLRSV
jgi:flagellar basal-body rod protein FlgF